METLFRRYFALPIAALALALSGCGVGAGGGGDTAPSPNEQWIKEIKAAGFKIAKDGLTYQDMFDRAQGFCDVANKGQLIQLASMALASEQGASMTAPGKDKAVAADRYADATWKHACGKE